MQRLDWDELSPLQISRFGEYLVKMEFTLRGFDVYTSEVGPSGIDLIICTEDGRHFDVLVHTVRGLSHVAMREEKFTPRDNLLVAIVVLREGKDPVAYLIPAKAWEEPNDLFEARFFEEMASKPEWGLHLSSETLALLDAYAFDKTISGLSAEVD